MKNYINNKLILMKNINKNIKPIIYYNVSQIKGSVTLKFIDDATGLEIFEPIVHSNLPFGSHTFNAPSIGGYNIIGTPIVSTTITISNPNAVIYLHYQTTEIEDIPPIEGNEINEVPYISTYYMKPIVKPNEEVIIDYYITDYNHDEYLKNSYIHTFTVTVKIDGKEDIVINNLKAGDHSVSLGSFSTEREQKFSILCTDQHGRNSHELFKYFLVENEIPVNEYVMTSSDLVTYNIKNNDNREIRVYVKVNEMAYDKADMDASISEMANKTTVPSGKYTCFIGTTEEDGNGNPVSQSAPARYYQNTVVKYSSDYNKEAVGEEAKNNRIGIQKLLDDKAEEGYNKIKLLKGNYRIDHEETIFIPTKLTLDLNESIIKLNQFTGDSSLLFSLNDTYNSHLINGIVEGDYYAHDYDNSPNNSEWVLGLGIMGGAHYSTVEDLIVQDFPGYGTINGIDKKRGETTPSWIDGYIYNTGDYDFGIGELELSDIDRNTGEVIESDVRRTSDYVDIAAKSESTLGYNDIGYMQVNKILGYQGMRGNSANLIVHFYDANKKFIKSTDGLQYRKIEVPSNAKFCKVTYLCSGDVENLKECRITLFKVPTNCSFKRIHHNNCRCVGMAQSAMLDMLVEDCSWERSGQTGAFCAYDAEDGWEQMQDATIRGSKFYNNYRNDLLTCAGQNFVIENQISGSIYVYERTRCAVIRNCNANIITPNSLDDKVKFGFKRVYDNVCNEYFGNYGAHNITVEGRALGLLFNSTIKAYNANHLVNPILWDFRNCTILIDGRNLGALASGTFTNCTFKPVDGFDGVYALGVNQTVEWSSTVNYIGCKFEGHSYVNAINAMNYAKFENCIFDDVQIDAYTLANEDSSIEFINCDINYSGYSLEKFGIGSFLFFRPFSYNVGTNCNVTFKDCNITKTNDITSTFLYVYAKPNGIVNFDNCTINIPQDTVMFGGLTSDIDKIESFTLNLNGCEMRDDVIYIQNEYITCQGLTILKDGVEV